jgi:pheromone shutdown protein TraB
MQDKELILIGTVHRDPEGSAKLSSLLSKECPVAVAVEVSPYGLFIDVKTADACIVN